ncbi:MAG: polyphosphate polymerase domain-containing protein [Patescibacteria group bacterium]|jgi:hypothetical protein
MKLAEQPKFKLHFQRFEFKYQASLDLVEGIIPELLKYMEWDPYAKNLPGNNYVVSSLYYDSVGLGCYYQKVDGDRTRKKLRVRFYDSDLKPEIPVFLEIKRKYDNVVIKDRLKLTNEQAYDLLNNNKKLNLNFSQHDQETLNEFLWFKIFNGMMPQNMVMYNRKPLVSKVDPNFRVTLDYNLRTYLAGWISNKKEGKLVNPGVVIIEVKFNNVLPFWFHSIIQRYNLDKRPFSKYCNSLEVCYPELTGDIAGTYQFDLDSNQINN